MNPKKSSQRARRQRLNVVRCGFVVLRRGECVAEVKRGKPRKILGNITINRIVGGGEIEVEVRELLVVLRAVSDTDNRISTGNRMNRSCGDTTTGAGVYDNSASAAALLGAALSRIAVLLLRTCKVFNRAAEALRTSFSTSISIRRSARSSAR